MKKLLFIIALFSGVSVVAQQEIKIQNNSSMELIFNFYIQDNTNGCGYVTNYSMSVLPGFDATPMLGTNEEYVWVEITPANCSGFGLTVGTPMQCNSQCQQTGVPVYDSAPSCSGNYGTVDARWFDCYSPLQGYIEINEF